MTSKKEEEKKKTKKVWGTSYSFLNIWRRWTIRSCFISELRVCLHVHVLPTYAWGKPPRTCVWTKPKLQGWWSHGCLYTVPLQGRSHLRGYQTDILDGSQQSSKMAQGPLGNIRSQNAINNITEMFSSSHGVAGGEETSDITNAGARRAPHPPSDRLWRCVKM